MTTTLESPDQLAAALDELAESPKLDRHEALAAKQGASVIREQHLALEAACQLEQASEPTDRQTFTVPDGAEPVLDAEGRATGELAPTPNHEADAGVRVKPLEWKPNGDHGWWSDELIFNVYYTIYNEGNGWRAFRGQFLSEAGEVELAYCRPPDEAKAAAQADYERRIRSALIHPTPDALAAAKAAGREEALEEAATLVEECARLLTGCSIDYASEQLAGAIRALKSPPHSTPPTSSKVATDDTLDGMAGQ